MEARNRVGSFFEKYPREISWLLFGLCLFTAMVAYCPGNFYLLNDDLIHIPESIKGNVFQNNFQRPVHELSLTMDYHVWGGAIIGYHITKLLIHISCVFLVLILSIQIFKRYGSEPSFDGLNFALIAASVFCLYPFHSESVLWILGRTASLACVFFLLSLVFLLSKYHSVIRLGLSLAFFGIGLFTYESVWILPVLVIFLAISDRYLTLEGNRITWKQASLFMIIFAGNLFFRHFYLGRVASDYELNSSVASFIKPLLLNYNRLLARSFLPPMDSTISFIGIYGLVLLGMAVLIYRYFRPIKKHYFLYFIIACFGLSLFPVITLGIDTHDRESERFLYLPSVFFCLSISYLMVMNRLDNLYKFLVIVVLLIGYSFFTFQNAKDYKMAGQLNAQFFEKIELASKSATNEIQTDLPYEFNGVPTLRIGLAEGINWLTTVDSARVHVKDTLEIKPVSGFQWLAEEYGQIYFDTCYSGKSICLYDPRSAFSIQKHPHR